MRLDLNTIRAELGKDKIEFSVQQQIKKFQTLLDSQRRVPNLILWQYNVVTKELTRAKFDKQDVLWNWDSSKILLNMKVTKLENCVYFQALNEENAWKKIKKLESE